MQRCPYCNVRVAGNKSQCPLCGGELTGEPTPETELFPALEHPRFSGGFVLRLIALIAIIVSAISILVNMAVSTRIWWSAFVVVGCACVWLAAVVGVVNRRDIMQNIAWQAVLIPILSIIWDKWTVWRGWSIDFVLPCVCLVALLCMLVLAVALKLPVHAYAGQFGLVGVLGIVPAVLVGFDKVRVVLPSLICAGLSVALLAAMLLFHWQTFKQEFVRRFHL